MPLNKKIEKWLRDCEKHPVISSLLLNLCFFAATYSVFTPIYETNDDVVMSMISAGSGRGGTPSEYLIHINVLIGLLLKYLNEISNVVPWYGLFMFFSLYLAFVAVYYIFIKIIGFKKSLAYYSVFFAANCIIILLNIEFTIVSIVVCSAAYFYFFYVGYLSKTRSPSVLISLSKYTPVIVLASLSAMIRFNSFLLMTLICIPIFFLVFYNSIRLERRNLLSTFVGLIVIIAIPLGLQSLHTFYYNRGEWKGVLEHVRLRGEFTDFHIIQSTSKNRPLFDHVGWSENDLKMLNKRFCADTRIFSLKNLRYVVSNIHQKRTLSFLYPIHCFFDMLHDDRARILLITTAASLPLIFLNISELFLILGTMVSILASGTYMVVFMKPPPPWVFIGTVFHLSLLSFFMFSCLRERKKNAKRFQKAKYFLTLASIILLTVAVVSSINLSRRRTAFATKRNASLENFVKSLPHGGNQLYVIWGPAFPYEYINPLNNLLIFKQLNTIGIGNFLATPISNRILNKLNINDIYMGLLEKNVFLLVKADSLTCLETYKNYMIEHYNTLVDYRVLYRFGPYIIVKFKKI